MDAGTVALLLTAIAGVGAMVLSAVKWRTEKPAAIAAQQTSLLQDMKLLNDELKERLDDLRSERDELKVEVIRLREEVTKLRHSVDDLH